MHRLAELDQRYLWHPFTQMRDWLKQEPLLIVEGRGATLRDARGREYLDANSSIWTNLHGHNHPRLNAAVRKQLGKIAHSSALGLANEPASLLAERLVRIANPAEQRSPGKAPRTRRLSKVFFSDDGSTAMEVALKLAYEFARRSGRCKNPKFLSLESAYHGDTVGAMALGHSDLFHQSYRNLVFRTDKVMSPYCYRCRFNRARPERADAREYRQCNWECLDQLDGKLKAQRQKGEPYAGFVFEPLIQGAAGMIAQPPSWLSQAAAIARNRGTLLLADEVMTGFGRTGTGPVESPALRPVSKTVGNARSAVKSPQSKTSRALLLGCEREGVTPDLLAVAKGLTGGYLPMAATLTTRDIFDVFLGEYHEFKTFFHGHSFTANQLGAAAALASLEILQSPASMRARQALEASLARELSHLWRFASVGDIRQVGLCAGVELVKNWRTREPFEFRARAGIRVCEAMAKRGVLTRPIGNVVVLMPPYCTSRLQVQKMVAALADAITDVL
jgi:adenosylmethionine-8-amino-7-oxononanoate aminotransferase